MSKRKVDYTDYANALIKALPQGALLTTKAGDKVNSMVIGWATIGVNWARPVIAVYVRLSRFTRTLLEQNPEFTVNVPVGSFDKNIIRICGSKSGRDMDKIQEAGLTLVEPEKISVPAVKEFPLTLECRVMYSQLQDLSALSEEINETLYPKTADANGDEYQDAHITFYGEIVDAYIVEE